MKLADLRKLSIRQNVRIRFSLSNGMECVITEHGLAQVPELRQTAGFNIEEELEQASRFVLEPIATNKKQAAAPAKPVDRNELAAMIGAAPQAAAEHEEE